MKKIKKLSFYLFGSLIAFFLKFVNISSAQSDFYGIEIYEPIQQKDPTLWDKISSSISTIISPIFIGIAVLVVVLIGALVFIKRKRKNA